MDAFAPGCGPRVAENPESAPLRRVPGWSIERLLVLLDEAIDSAGAQLARSAGLWDDTQMRQWRVRSLVDPFAVVPTYGE